ncbi:MAG: class III extradiol ring-cleavage dioxygenase [Candidatus Izemoplasma sp.]
MSKTVYLPHGGGPLPLIDQKTYINMNKFIKNIGESSNPEAIIVFSAHLETKEVTVIYDNIDNLLFDYYGFPEETYKYEYNPPKAIKLGKSIITKLNKAGIKTVSSTRGFDHGVFIPLMIMYPKATIPVIQISLKEGLDELFHINLGKALSFLKDDNILFLGSGFSFHNIREFFNNKLVDDKNNQFHDWLTEVISSDKLSEEQRTKKLINWVQAPNSSYVHPTAEHLIPLHICYGINQRSGKVVFNEEINNKTTIGVLWE